VLIVTALTDQEDRYAGLAAGADDFLTKPIDRRELALRVRLFLSLREHGRIIRQQLADLAAREAVISQKLEETQHLELLKDDLMSLILHDLRNPLAGVTGFLELIETEPSIEHAHAYAKKANASATRLRALTEEILEVRRLEERVLSVRVEPVSVRSLLTSAASTIDGAARIKGIDLRIAGSDDHTLSIDAGLVRRVLENLLLNAVKFSSQGDSVDAVASLVVGGTAIEISDRGPGISDSMKVALFTKFGSAGPRRGFGLGLYLVSMVAAAHQGNVSVRDREGGGTTFRLFLPDKPTKAATCSSSGPRPDRA
jgi:signal transduction histidine kinase